MRMMEATNDIRTNINAWLERKLTNQQIEAELYNRGYEDRHVVDMMKEVVKLRNARKTSGGLVLILIGAVVCLLSCVLTLTGSYSGATFTTILYGFTTIGIVIVFAGLMKIFN